MNFRKKIGRKMSSAPAEPVTTSATSPHHGHMKNFLSTLNVSDVPPPKQMVLIDSNESFVSGFTKLVSAHLLAAPVYDAKVKKFIGYLEIRDLLSIIISAHEQENPPKDIDELLKHAHDQFIVTDGVTLTYLARRTPFVKVGLDATLLDVAVMLSTRKYTRTRRVAVIDGNGKLVNIISQRGLLDFVATHPQLMNHKGDKTVKELNLGTYPAKTVSGREPTGLVFEKLEKTGLSGLGIVNEQGMIIGNISGRDLKNFVKQPDLSKLKMSIADFLKELRQESVDIRAPAFVCNDHTTFKYVIEKLAATKAHRLYVVDSDTTCRPTGVISCSDVIVELLGN